MDIQECSQFINTFCQAMESPARHYLVKQNERYAFIADKKNKNLNIEQIAELSEKCLKTLIESSSSYEDPLKLIPDMVKMVETLTRCFKRVSASKPWYGKILLFFGIKSRHERKIEQLAPEFIKLGYIQTKLSTSKEGLKKFSQEPGYQLTEFYHKMLGFASLKENELKKAKTILEGNGSYLSKYSLISDLETFKSCCQNQDKETIQQAIQELSFACHIQLLLFIFGLIGRDKSFSATINRQLQEVALQKIFAVIMANFRQLPNDQRLLLPGGYVSIDKDGHAVLYEIIKALDGYHFRIINTGDGTAIDNEEINLLDKIGKVKLDLEKSPLSIQARDLKKLELSTLKKAKNKLKIRDLTFTNLNQQDLSENFIKQLIIDYTIKKSSNFSMNTINKFIESKLNKRHPSNRSLTGREHHRQRKGVCSMKCLTVWLHDRIGDSLHHQFKAFMAERQMESLKQVKRLQIEELKKVDKFQNINIANLLDEMEAIGQEVLIKRKLKTNQINSTQG